MSDKKIILIGLIFILLGIVLGAMGAHYLETIGISEEKINSFSVGNTYLFSGSIFSLVLLPVIGIDINKFLGPITPIGGVVMIFGWLVLLIKHLATYKT